MPDALPLRVTAVAASGQLGGTERVLLDFATRAFEHDIALRVITPRDGPLVAILNEVGVPAEVVPGSRALLSGSQQARRLWSLPLAVPGLFRWAGALARHRFVRDADVLYTVAFKADLAVALRRQHPVVWHLHEFPPAATGPLWRALARRIPDGLIANSEAVAAAWSGVTSERVKSEEVKGEKVNSEKVKSEKGKQADPERPFTSYLSPFTDQTREITVIPNGVDLDRFVPRPATGWIHDELGIDRGRRLIGMPAVFARWKGQPEVIAAFEQMRDAFPDVHLVIVGGSIYDTVAEREYGAELAGLVTDARVHLLPFQSKIERVYPEFDAVVHYSLRPEPFGRVIVEAMACGVPVIAAGEGGPVQILGGGIGPRREAGWLAEPRSPAALARIFRAALDLPAAVLRDIGAAGRRRAEDYYSARVFARRVAVALWAASANHRGA